MATRAKLLNVPLDIATGPQTITGMGFQPDFVIFMMTNMTGAGSGSNMRFAFGGGAPSNKGATFNIAGEDGVVFDSGLSYTANNSPAFVRMTNEEGVSLFSATLTSFTSDGLIIDIDTAPAAAWRLHILGFSSDTPTPLQVASGTLICNGSIGNQDITGLGFTSPDFVIFLQAFPQASSATWSAGNLSSQPCIGWAAGATQAAIHCINSHGSNPSNMKRSIKWNRCMHLEGNTTLPLSFSFVNTPVTDGFRINIVTTTGSPWRIGYIAVKGVSAKVINHTGSTTTGATPVTGVGFQPSAMLAISAGTTVETHVDDSRFNVGFMRSTTERVAYSTGVLDNQTPVGSVSQQLATDAFLIDIQPNHGTPSVLNKFDVDAIGPDGITYDHEIEDKAPLKMSFLFIGPAIGGNQTITPTGIASAQAFGTPTFFSGSAAQTFTPTGIASAQAFGTPVFGGAKIIQPTGIRGPDYKDVELTGTFDDVAFSPTFTQYKVELIGGPDPRSAFVQFGTSTHTFLGVAPGTYTSRWSLSNAAGTTLANTQTDEIVVTNMGTPVFVVGGGGGGFIILPTGIPSATSFGNPFFNAALLPTGIPTAEAFGTPTFATGGLAFLPTSIPSGETFGTPTFLEHQLFFVVGIPSEEAFGNTLIEFEGAQTLNVPGIETGEAFGTATFSVPPEPPSQTWPPIEDPHTVWIRVPRGREG